MAFRFKYWILSYLLIACIPSMCKSCVYASFDNLDDFDQLVIPLKRANKLLLVEGRIGNQTGNFVLDFGAEHLVLNQTYFRDYELVKMETAGSVVQMGLEVFRTDVDTLEIRELIYTDIEADVLDLGHIENKRGVKIIGLLGVDLFKAFEVEIDLMKNLMVIYKLDGLGNRSGKINDSNRKPDVILPFNFNNGLIIFPVEIGGKKLDVCFDSAAEVNVIDKSIPKKALEKITITGRKMLRGASRGGIEVLSGKMKETYLENTAIEEMNMILTDLGAIRSVYGVHVDCMMGYELLAQGILSINFFTKELRLKLY